MKDKMFVCRKCGSEDFNTISNVKCDNNGLYGKVSFAVCYNCNEKYYPADVMKVLFPGKE